MKIRLIILSAFLLVVGARGTSAQNYSATVPDGLVVRPDSLALKPRPSFLLSPPSFFLSPPSFQPLQQPDLLFSPSGIETRQQRAARINMQTYSRVMASVDKNLLWYRPPKLTEPWDRILGAAKLFLSDPYGFPEGCVPLMNHSFPFIYAKTPGMAPYDNPYTSDRFRKCIETEYDPTTGTYKQVRVDWSEVQSKKSCGR